MTEFLSSFSDVSLFSDMLVQYGNWLVFAGVFLTGEAAILTTFMLVEQGVLDFFDVFIIAILATLAADMFWFIVGRFFPTSFLPKIVKNNLFEFIQNFLDKFIKGRLFLTILCMKFFIGTRLIIILYCAKQKISTSRFIYYNIISIFVYLLVLSGIGLVIGKFVKNIIPAYKTGTTIIMGILICVAVLSILKTVIQKYIVNLNNTD